MTTTVQDKTVMAHTLVREYKIIKE
jgi:hypothetical protein